MILTGPRGGAPVPSIRIQSLITSVSNGPSPSPSRRSGAGFNSPCDQAICGKLSNKPEYWQYAKRPTNAGRVITCQHRACLKKTMMVCHPNLVGAAGEHNLGNDQPLATFTSQSPEESDVRVPPSRFPILPLPLQSGNVGNAGRDTKVGPLKITPDRFVLSSQML